jgi:hypothetical protein
VEREGELARVVFRVKNDIFSALQKLRGDFEKRGTTINSFAQLN